MAQPGVELVAQRLRVEELHDRSGVAADALDRVAVDEQHAVFEGALAQERTRVVEDHEVDRVGAEGLVARRASASSVRRSRRPAASHTATSTSDSGLARPVAWEPKR